MSAPVKSTQETTSTGFGRILVAVYGVFAISASARAAFQLITAFSEAPVAYSLSGVAAVIYVVATVALATRARWSRGVAWVAVACEAVGVVTVSAWSTLAPGHFAQESVWSHWGSGYGYVPAVLPFVGLWWLVRTRAASR